MDENDRRLAAELEAAWVANVRDLADRVAAYAPGVGVDDEALAASMESVARRLRVVAARRLGVEVAED